MIRKFKNDLFPGKPKILFIGLAESTHTHAWIDLLANAELNVRLFALPKGIPPSVWHVKTYVTMLTSKRFNPEVRAKVYPPGHIGHIYKRLSTHLDNSYPAKELARVIQNWNPDVIHTLGLEPSSFFFDNVRRKYGLTGIGRWVVQARGGPDLALHRLLSEYRDKIQSVLIGCDQLIADNLQNYDYAQNIGLDRSKIALLGMIPGTGGIDVEKLSGYWKTQTALRRTIIFPKAYECPQSKSLPVFEALKLVWKKIQPCHIDMLAADYETMMWYQTLPKEIRSSSKISYRIPRSQVLSLMANARVMLAPSLSDGIPNSLYEAMACGALPIISPLETIKSVVKPEQNALFARNLYPEEIADALIRAMTDDTLVNRVAQQNLALVRQIADRAILTPRVIDYYLSLIE